METLLAVDDMISGVLKALSDSGKIDSTYIFMLADNGDDYSRHTGFSGKLLPYEEGVRTPLIVRVPGMRSAASCDQLVSAVDLLPFMTKLAGAPRPGFAAGRSLVPLPSNSFRPASAWRDACLVELGKFEKWYYRSHPPPYALLRFKERKYIEYETGEKEYYDLRADPDELENIFQDLDPALKSRLHEQLREALAREAGLKILPSIISAGSRRRDSFRRGIHLFNGSTGNRPGSVCLTLPTGLEPGVAGNGRPDRIGHVLPLACRPHGAANGRG